MPLYEFRCDTCGSFETWRSMAQASEPMLCPSCDTLAQRIYSVAGLILTPSTSLSRRIEQSAEPKVQQRQSQSHSHHHKHHHGRPWMIGH
ncbi:FmdB family zinc ribbon protein [Chroogloeocystis siderophila]|jgi:putative FmdB family regulatory protein|uniref:Transcriptional regulator n=1 Tax=Chroogloeocystis siderophila 5.2 s.c.1 TaxID=247279 RepID=A0A1U7HPG0_9CHRO|nr:zinc ribbon domain-containing protein [Chroogloeocystis siderophila]OKH25438.1 transcriptional regulator [Chroogloeocystis siderophila 5.2 s.c.1]